MARELKCQYCLKTSPKEQMQLHLHTAVPSGHVTRKYFHKELCMDAYLADQEFKAKEAEEMDELYNVLKKLHKLDVIPTNFFSMHLQPLRNGTFKLGKKTRKYKEGIPYSLMKDAYLHVEFSVDWARDNKKFDGAMGFLKYTFAIMVDKLPVVKKANRQKELAKQISNDQSNGKRSQEDILFEEREIVFKKRKNGVDISDLLD